MLSPQALPGYLRTALGRIDYSSGSAKINLAEAAATAIREEFGATLGLATVLRPMQADDPDGHSGTAIAVASARGVRSRYYAYGSDRVDAPAWSTTHTMALARRVILRGQA